VSFKIQIQIERKLPRVTLVYTFDLHCVAKLPENKKMLTLIKFFHVHVHIIFFNSFENC